MQFFTQLFSSDQKHKNKQPPNQHIIRIFTIITNPDTKFNVAKKTLQSFIQQDLSSLSHFSYFLDHAKQLFTFLENPQISHYPSPFSILQLLSTIHSSFSNQTIQEPLAQAFKDKKIWWLIKDDIPFIERLITEPSTSSVLCASKNKQVRSPTPKDISKTEVQEEKTKKQQAIHHKRRERYYKNQSQVILNHQDPITPQKFCQFYYSYLQKVAINLDLYIAIKEQRYPYKKNDEILENKSMFMWLYKIQNLIQIGTLLLEEKNLSMDVYTLVGQDMEDLQDFVVQQLQNLIENYSHMCASDLLSLNEIYQDCIRQQNLLVKSKLMKPIQIDKQLLDEFQTFIIRIKVLSQVQFKRQIQVPNKKNPYWLLEQKTEPFQERQERACSFEKKFQQSDQKKHHRQKSSFINEI